MPFQLDPKELRDALREGTRDAMREARQASNANRENDRSPGGRRVPGFSLSDDAKVVHSSLR